MRVTIYISLWTNYNWNIQDKQLYYSCIYISLWTNYNTWKLQKIWRFFYKFTFHYELIITVKDYVIDEDELIYISLWTNYNKM